MIDIQILKDLTSDITAEDMAKCQYLGNNKFVIDNNYIIHFHENWNLILCSCLSGRSGFKNSPRYCWHVRTAMAY